jgi:N6-adenosine-specific RNA methylase IME4
MRYANIVFMQGEEGHEVVDKLCNVEGVVAHGATAESITETIEYLSQWDFGTESEHDIRDSIGAGTHDTVVEEGEYVLTYNLGHGYVGLMRKVETDDEIYERQSREPGAYDDE